MDVRLVKLHEYHEFLSSVVELLNSEWPRSETARLRSLTDSRDDLPCCLLLLTQDNQEKTIVIGQSKLTKVHGRIASVYIENVVIHKAKRGHGYGKKLMQLSEDYAQKLGYKTIHLNTHDKCKFYEHLGYQYSSAVTPVRANAKILTPEQFSALQSHFGEKIVDDTAENCKEKELNPKELNSLKPQQDICDPQETTESIEQLKGDKDKTQQMKNNSLLSSNMVSAITPPLCIVPSPPSVPPLSCIVPSPPAPPPLSCIVPPPPPVPPPPCIEHPSSSTASSKGKDHLYWMVKKIP